MVARWYVFRQDADIAPNCLVLAGRLAFVPVPTIILPHASLSTVPCPKSSSISSDLPICPHHTHPYISSRRLFRMADERGVEMSSSGRWHSVG